MGFHGVKTFTAFLGFIVSSGSGSELKQVGIADCTFVADREQFVTRQGRTQREIAERLAKLDRAFDRKQAVAAPVADIRHRNFIDDEIFRNLAVKNVAPASLSSDQEFFRRIYLDLTGRIPSPDDIRTFLADSSPTKRDDVIDRLLYSPEFEDRWTMWLGDLLQNTAFSSNFSRQTPGRDAFYNWLRAAMFNQKSIKDLAYEAVIAVGNNYNSDLGAANFLLGASTPMGPIQDTYDTMLVKTANAFLGLAYYDCLLCHNGRGHLDQISLWGSTTTRLEAEQMAAFFARTRLTRNPSAQNEPLYNSYAVMNAASGGYDLNTNYGNRPARTPVGTTRSFTPQYRLGGPASGEWRDSFAAYMTADPMFARNIVNRIWKQFFGLGLVDPVDTMDPARLDPSNPPPAPWTLQASHPDLLERLAQEFVWRGFNLREFIRVLVQSSAYQLSSRYDGDWQLQYVPLYARHYPRRLEGEEVADAITKATGIPGGYAASGWPGTKDWAMQMPEPAEPRGGAAAFLNSFFRGNRDTAQRSQSGSILQQLNLMNDTFVLNRIRAPSSPVLQSVAKLPANDAVLEQMFLLFLSRQPTAYEREKGLAFLNKATTTAARNAAIEDLAWVCINKLDFLFSY